MTAFVSVTDAANVTTKNGVLIQLTPGTASYVGGCAGSTGSGAGTAPASISVLPNQSRVTQGLGGTFALRATITRHNFTGDLRLSTSQSVGASIATQALTLPGDIVLPSEAANVPIPIQVKSNAVRSTVTVEVSASSTDGIASGTAQILIDIEPDLLRPMNLSPDDDIGYEPQLYPIELKDDGKPTDITLYYHVPGGYGNPGDLHDCAVAASSITYEIFGDVYIPLGRFTARFTAPRGTPEGKYYGSCLDGNTVVPLGNPLLVSHSSVTEISSISPSTWVAGTQTEVTLCGFNLGTSDSISLSDTSITTSAIQMISDGCPSGEGIVFTVNVPPGTPDENVTVTAEVSSIGISLFQSGTGPVARGSASVRSQASPLILLYLSGQRISEGSTVVIDGSPSFPDVSVRLSMPPGVLSPVGAVNWHFSASYSYHSEYGNNIFDGIYSCSFLSDGSVSLPYETAWSLRTQAGTGICGGTATVDYTFGALKGSATFVIKGQNVPYQTTQAYLNTFKYEYGQLPWFLFQLVNQESAYRQFRAPIPSSVSTPSTAGVPLLGPPRGFGVMQVEDPPSSFQLWDWRENVKAGVAAVNATYLTASKRWKAAQDAFTSWNSDHPTSQVDPPIDTSEGNCSFSFSPSGQSHSFLDALWVKSYNSGQPYIQFVTPRPGVASGGWRINPLGLNGTNYIQALCAVASNP